MVRPSEQLRLYACLNAKLQNGFTNPIDQAIASLNISLNDYEKINEVPYDFIRKRLSVAVKNNQQRFFVTKGHLAMFLKYAVMLKMKTGRRNLLMNKSEKL